MILWSKPQNEELSGNIKYINEKKKKSYYFCSKTIVYNDIQISNNIM